jgi:hypothetical protein
MRNFWPLATTFAVLMLCSISAQAFRDDFNTLNSSNWTIHNNEGGTSVENGRLILHPTNGYSSPFVYLNFNPFPTEGDFVVRLGIQYTRLGQYGTGVMAATSLPENGVGSETSRFTDIVFSYWGSGYSNDKDKNYHDIEFQYESGNITTLQDDLLIDSYTTSNRPSVIWLGNPVYASWPGYWTSFEVDYIEVIPVPEPSSLVALLGGLGTLSGMAKFRKKQI